PPYPGQIPKFTHSIGITLPSRESHLAFAEIREVLNGGSPFVGDLIIFGSKIRRALALKKGLSLTTQIARILSAVRRSTDIHHVAVTPTLMAVLDGVHHIGMPPDRVSRLNEGDARQGRQ